jgi:hypothetical protein
MLRRFINDAGTSCLMTLAILACVSTSVNADEPAPTRKGVQKLFGIDWQPGLHAPIHTAQKRAPAKPIVLLRVLGELDDKL